MTRDMRRLTLDFSVAGKLWMTVNHVKCISSELVCVCIASSYINVLLRYVGNFCYVISLKLALVILFLRVHPQNGFLYWLILSGKPVCTVTIVIAQRAMIMGRKLAQCRKVA